MKLAGLSWDEINKIEGLEEKPKKVVEEVVVEEVVAPEPKKEERPNTPIVLERSNTPIVVERPDTPIVVPVVEAKKEILTFK